MLNILFFRISYSILIYIRLFFGNCFDNLLVEFYFIFLAYLHLLADLLILFVL